MGLSMSLFLWLLGGGGERGTDALTYVRDTRKYVRRVRSPLA